MAKSINRYFQLMASSRDVKPSGRLWDPAADVYVAPDGWLVKIELAGVSSEDVDISVEGSGLVVSGTRRDRTCDHGVSYHQMEITYSRFEKVISFPESIEGMNIEQEFDNGLLIIKLKRI